MIGLYKRITLEQALFTFVPLFVLCHNLNVDDTFSSIVKSKSKYVKDVLVNAIESGEVPGKIVMSDDGYTDYESGNIDCVSTMVDIEATIELLFKLLSKNKNKIPITFGTFEAVKISDVSTFTNAKSESVTKSEAAEFPSSDNSKLIRATVAATLYCVAQEQEISITKNDIDIQLRHEGYYNFPVEDIFQAIPEPLRHSGKGGPPKKTLDKAVDAAFYSGIVYFKKHKIELKELQEKVEKKCGKLRPDILQKIYKCVQEDHEAEE